MVTDKLHMMPESMRCAWYALGCHDMTRSLESFSAFQTYLNCFKTAETEPKKNEYYKFVEHLFRPMFANIHRSHVPQHGSFADYELNHVVTVSLQEKWDKTFTIKKNSLIWVPLFQA